MISWPSKSTLQRPLDLAGLHYTTSERSGPFWQSMLHNFLSRPLSFLDWTTAMLFWLDFHQTQSNLYKWFRMRRHDWSSTSPKEPMLHLSLSPCTGYQSAAARIQFKTLMLAYRTTTGSAPTYFPPPFGLLDPCKSSSNNWKLISFNSTWLHHHKKIKQFTFSKSSSFSLSFSPSLASLYLFEQCLRLGVMGTSSVCLPLLD